MTVNLGSQTNRKKSANGLNKSPTCFFLKMIMTSVMGVRRIFQMNFQTNWDSDSISAILEHYSTI